MDFTKDIKFNRKPTSNQQLRISYYGKLVKEKSKQVSLIYGFGENWEKTTEKQMEKISDGFTTKIKVKNYNTLNFCFKNEKNNWDNNNSFNYITSIYSKPQLSKPKTLNLSASNKICSNEIDNLMNYIDIDFSKNSDKTIQAENADILDILMQEIIDEYSAPIIESSPETKIDSLSNDVEENEFYKNTISDSFYDDINSFEYNNLNDIVSSTVEKLDKEVNNETSLEVNDTENQDFKNLVNEYAENFYNLINEIVEDANTNSNINSTETTEESYSENIQGTVTEDSSSDVSETVQEISVDSSSDVSENIQEISEEPSSDVSENVQEFVSEEPSSDVSENVQEFVSEEPSSDVSENVQEFVSEEPSSDENISCEIDVSQDPNSPYEEIENFENGVPDEYALYDYKSYNLLYLIKRRFKQIFSTLFSKLPKIFKKGKNIEDNN